LKALGTRFILDFLGWEFPIRGLYDPLLIMTGLVVPSRMVTVLAVLYFSLIGIEIAVSNGNSPYLVRAGSFLVHTLIGCCVFRLVKDAASVAPSARAIFSPALLLVVAIARV